MARVCTDWFPMGSRPYQKDIGFYLDDNLKLQLDILLKNIIHDWDFTIIISGKGEVRVGKSMIAQQIGAYWTWKMFKEHGIKCPFNVKDNFVFDGKKLIEVGNKLGTEYPNSVLIFDEAGADLEGRKTMQTITQDVLDYFRECGQYNMLNIIVLPEFFDLPKGIAITRSIFLIDVDYTANEEGIFIRGNFNFYSRRSKKFLYLMGKRDLNYNVVKRDFPGKFTNFWAVDEKEYRNAKHEALLKRESKRRNKFQIQRDACWYLLFKEYGLSQVQLAKRMEQLTGIFVAQQTISDGLSHFKLENE